MNGAKKRDKGTETSKIADLLEEQSMIEKIVWAMEQTSSKDSERIYAYMS